MSPSPAIDTDMASFPMPEALTWTTGKPSKPDSTGIKHRACGAHVAEVVYDSQSKWLYITQTGAVVDELKEDEYRWAGPLMQPSESQKCDACWAQEGAQRHRQSLSLEGVS